MKKLILAACCIGLLSGCATIPDKSSTYIFVGDCMARLDDCVHFDEGGRSEYVCLCRNQDEEKDKSDGHYCWGNIEHCYGDDSR